MMRLVILASCLLGSRATHEFLFPKASKEEARAG